MSVQHMRDFFEKVQSDEGLQAKLKELEGQNESEETDLVVKMAAAAGFTFTAAELIKAREARKSGELSPEELASVAGGRMRRRGGGGGDCCYWASGSMPGS